jgi:uncharacterized protein (TIGR02145 family)
MKNLLTILFAFALGLNLSAQVPNYVPTDGLVGWWPMNGNVDDAIGSLHGFNQGGVETEGPYGQVGQALELPSGDDYIDVPTGGVNEEGGLTLAFWAWLELPTEGAAPLIDRVEVGNNLWSFSYEQSSETVHFMTRNNDGSGYNNLSTWSPPAAEWVHVTSVYRAPSGLKELHVNGSLVGEELAPLDGFTMPTLRLGEVAEGTWNSNCRFSKVGVWERALVEEEILALYNAQLPVLGCTDSIACNFNEEANIEDDSCVYPLFGEDCETGGAACGEGTIWDANIQACVVSEFCQEDLDGDGVIGINDLMQLLSSFGTMCPIWMCGDPVNYHGYDYATVQIAEQCWFAENLRTELYSNGDAIPGELSEGEWSNTDSTNLGAQTIYTSNPANLADYGRLYNWYAVDDDRGLCLAGWHVPTDVEFMTLEMELGMSESEANGMNYRGSDQGTQLKSSPDDSPSWNGTNTSGFSGLAGGVRYADGSFYLLTSHVYFWSASLNGEYAWYRNLYTYNSEVSRNYFDHQGGFSVRCVRD